MNEDHTFITSSLPLAAYIVTAGRLEFRGIEVTTPGSAEFIFNDPQSKGREIAREFSNHAMVSATAYHAQFRKLRGMLNEKLLTARSGVTDQFTVKGNHNAQHQLLL